jgi:tetratricopeptide (TPR) repeat protein
MKKTLVCLNLILLIVVNITVCRIAAAEGTEAVKPPGKVAYEDRIQFVSTLLEKSSAAQRVSASDNPEAKQKHEYARLHFQEAQQAHEAGDLETANNKLIEATKIMFEAVRLAEQKDVIEVKKRRDYKDRLDSINALMEAHERVSQEKGKETEGIELEKVVSDKISEADALLKAGQLDEARIILDEAYVAAKIAINSLRGGDTLVRSLNFETREEEYLYEIDRNDTHQMLIKILAKENKQGKGMDKMVQGFMDKAAELRGEAEEHAASGEYEAAIRTLEESTKNLVRALRSAGVYIPG